MDWPLQSEVDAFYGNPRGRYGGGPSYSWTDEYLVKVRPLPFAMKFGSQPVREIVLHRKCKQAFLAVLEQIWDTAEKKQSTISHWGMDKFAGAFNYRLIKGSNNLSMHAYGCAFDFDPVRNQMGAPHGHFEICPEVLNAWILQGAEWGGIWQHRPDWMHWQFARTR